MKTALVGVGSLVAGGAMTLAAIRVFTDYRMFSSEAAPAEPLDVNADGPWTGADWYDEVNKVGVANGVPYSNDAATDDRINASWPIDVAADVTILENVQRIQRLLTQEQWNYIHYKANPLYTYDRFLAAAGRYPDFCNSSGSGYSLDDACKRELSTLFAHFARETGTGDWRSGLYWVTEIYCTAPNWAAGTANCDYKSTNWSAAAWPPQSGVQYYGRGPFQLSWNYNYGQFSNIAFTQQQDDKMILLRDPAQLEGDGAMALFSALWFYMTPQNPKPSMHEIASGQFIPNASDTAAGISDSFGATTNVINGGLECGKGAETDGSNARASFYASFLDYFGLPAEANCGCASMQGFPTTSASATPQYFDTNWAQTNTCKLVSWMTKYALYAETDYKKCVVDSWTNSASGTIYASINSMVENVTDLLSTEFALEDVEQE